ncbi:MAG: DUF2155 domain-containing protein [Pseudomonadota bacterium]
MRRVLVLLALAPLAAFAQSDESGGGAKFDKAPEGVIYSESEPEDVEEIIRVEKPISRSEPRPVAILRGLDKISGRVSDIRADVGATVTYERLTITVEECREPPEADGEDAYVFLKVRDAKTGDDAIFSGWMFASSPALSAMDHARYDLWALSCATS